MRKTRKALVLMAAAAGVSSHYICRRQVLLTCDPTLMRLDRAASDKLAAHEAAVARLRDTGSSSWRPSDYRAARPVLRVPHDRVAGRLGREQDHGQPFNDAVEVCPRDRHTVHPQAARVPSGGSRFIITSDRVEKRHDGLL